MKKNQVYGRYWVKNGKSVVKKSSSTLYIIFVRGTAVRYTGRRVSDLNKRSSGGSTDGLLISVRCEDALLLNDNPKIVQ